MRNKKTWTWNRLPGLCSQRGAPHPLHSTVSSYWHLCYILLKRSLRINQTSLLLLPSLFTVSFTDALMPNPPPPSGPFSPTGKRMRENIKTAVQLASSLPWGVAIFHGERGRERGKKQQIYESSSMHVSGRALLLTMEPHWQRLGGHHEGAIEGEDSQELQG